MVIVYMKIKEAGKKKIQKIIFYMVSFREKGIIRSFKISYWNDESLFRILVAPSSAELLNVQFSRLLSNFMIPQLWRDITKVLRNF